jgi:hypothetical protein
VAEDRLCRFHRLAHFSEQRCVYVPEGMPRHSRQFQPVTGWCKFAVVQIFRTEWRALKRAKSKVVWFCPSALLFVRFQYVVQFPPTEVQSEATKCKKLKEKRKFEEIPASAWWWLDPGC